VSAAYDDSTSAQVKAANQTKALAREIELQKNKLDTQRTMLAKAKEAHGENSAQAQKWQQVVAESEAELARLNAELKKTPSQLQAFGQDMQAAGKKAEAVGKAVSKVGATLTKAVTAPVVALGTAAVKTTADFDASMSKVRAVSGATGSQFEALRAKAREMGAQTKFSASEAADAMNYMAMAGWKTEDMLSGVEGIMSLAAASGEDLATTSDIVTDALTAFGKSAKDSGRMADIMAAASSNANTNVAMMGETFKYAAPVAGALGISMEDTAVAVGLMANAGIKASNAGTALRTGLSRMVGPTKQSKEAMEKYNIAVKTNADGSVNLRETMQSLRKKMSQLSETEQTAAAKAIFGANAYAGWLAVINGSDDDFEKLTSAIDNSSGTAKRMAEIMQDNLSGQITILKSQVQELGISFGDILVPHIRKAVEVVQNTVDAFNSLDDSEKEQIVKLAAIAAAAGPVLTIGGKLISTGGALITTGGQLITLLSGAGAAAEAGAAGVGLLGGAMAALPVVGAIAGIAALAAIVYKLSKDADGTQGSMVNLSSQMSELQRSSDLTKSSLDKAVDGIKDLAAENDNALAKTEAAANLAGRYADELAELDKKTTKTSADQAKMQVIVSKLNKIYPNLNLSIDETTGKLNMSTDALKANIEQMKIQMKIAAYQDYMTEQMKKLVEVETKVVEAETKKSEAFEKSAEAAKRQDEIQAALKAEQEELAEATKALDEVLKKEGATAEEIAAAEARMQEAGAAVNDGMVNLNGTMVDVTQAMFDAADAQRTAESTMSTLDQTIREGEEAAAGLNEGIDTNVQKITELSAEADKMVDSMTGAAGAADGMSDAITATGEAADGAAGAIDEATEEIQKSWEKAYESARESVMEQGSIFDELSEKATTSIEQMRENLEKQIESYRSWNENATFLMGRTEYSTNENFRNMVNYVVSAGQSMSPELQAIVDAYQSGDESLTAITEDYGTMSRLADDVATTTADAVTAAEYGLEGLETAFGDSFAAAAKTTESRAKELPASAASGISSGQGKFKSAAKSTANGGASEFFHAILINKAMASSASRELVTASAESIENTKPQVANAGKATGIEGGKQLVAGANSQKTMVSTAGRSLGVTFAEAIKGTKETVTSNAKAVGHEGRNIAVESNAQKETVKGAGEALGKTYADGITSKKETVKEAGKGVAQAGKDGINAVSTASAKEWGQHLGQNLADGIWDKYDAVKKAAEALASAAADPLKHSTPKEGPLMHDDVWGLHLAQNFADAMIAGKATVKAAALELAAEANVPTYTDPVSVSGKRSLSETIQQSISVSPLGGLDPERIYEAVRAGASSITLQIGDRELGRVLRDMGVVFA